VPINLIQATICHGPCLRVPCCPLALPTTRHPPITAILMNVRWYLTVVLIRISLVIKDSEYFLMLLAIWCLPFRNVYFNLLPSFQFDHGFSANRFVFFIFSQY
jgi:hypothetical protein